MDVQTQPAWRCSAPLWFSSMQLKLLTRSGIIYFFATGLETCSFQKSEIENLQTVLPPIPSRNTFPINVTQFPFIDLLFVHGFHGKMTKRPLGLHTCRFKCVINHSNAVLTVALQCPAHDDVHMLKQGNRTQYKDEETQRLKGLLSFAKAEIRLDKRKGFLRDYGAAALV